MTRTPLTAHSLWTTVVMLGMAATTPSAVLARGEQTAEPALEGRPVPVASATMVAPQLPDTATRHEELRKWIGEFSEWMQWAEQWSNRRQPGLFTGYRERRQRPAPPAWLIDRCDNSVDDTEAIVEACTLVAQWKADYPAIQAAAARAAAAKRAEQIVKTTWWEHVHLAGGWTAMQSGTSLYGVIGVHATTTVRGRLSVFVAPGAMLMNVPTTDGRRAWKVATNYGVSYRLGDIAFPGRRQARLHLNLAKAWLLNGGGEVGTNTTDLVGLSITFTKTN